MGAEDCGFALQAYCLLGLETLANPDPKRCLVAVVGDGSSQKFSRRIRIMVIPWIVYP